MSPTRPRQSFIANNANYNINNIESKAVSEHSPEKPQTLFNIDSIRNIDQNASQSVIVTNPNKNRVLVPSS